MKPGMKSRWPLFLLALILAAFACNWSEVVPPPAPVIEPSPLPTFAISTLTPVPTETPMPTPTSTPEVPVALPKELGVNCRYGPGQEWEVISSIPVGTTAEIEGRTVNTAWWYVTNPMKTDGSFCWVAYDVVDTAGNLNIVRIIEPPEASVTEVTVGAVIVSFAACPGSNQVSLNGTIKANGPTTARYHWEVNGAAQESTEERTVNFSQSGTNTVSAEVSLSECGEYTAELRVTEPNESSAQKIFSIQNP